VIDCGIAHLRRHLSLTRAKAASLYALNTARAEKMQTRRWNYANTTWRLNPNGAAPNISPSTQVTITGESTSNQTSRAEDFTGVGNDPTWKSSWIHYTDPMSALTHALIEEIKATPEPMQREVLDFLVFLKTRHAAAKEGGEDLLPLAQSAWAADWNTPEEDEAWRDL